MNGLKRLRVNCTSEMLIVEPAVATEIPFTPTRELVAGTLITIWESLVPESVMLTPENPSVEPEAVVLPEVLAPRRLTQLFSAAAPGAATLTEIPSLAIVPEALVPWKAAVA